MYHAMFDIDGTLIQSYEFDEKCFLSAVREVSGLELINNWRTYPHITARGILMTFIERQAPKYKLNELEGKVKRVFIENIKNHINSFQVQEVLGAKEFIKILISNDDFRTSIATGGWKESAILKLESAGFNVDNIVISSSNDHYSRMDIMKIAQTKFGGTNGFHLTYFGDAEWDVRSCRELDVNLVIVGGRVAHHQAIKDFQNIEDVMEFITR